MKKICLILAFFMAGTFLFASENIGFEFGIGSGYNFYGSDSVRKRNEAVSDGNQIIFGASTGMLYKLDSMVYLCLGLDSLLDYRWDGGNHISLFDYAGTLGFHIYPGLAGLECSVDYAFGRRSDYVSINEGTDDYTSHTDWGNGFKFGLAYNFAYNTNGFAPVLGAYWRHMPRGGSSDNILFLFIRIDTK